MPILEQQIVGREHQLSIGPVNSQEFQYPQTVMHYQQHYKCFLSFTLRSLCIECFHGIIVRLYHAGNTLTADTLLQPLLQGFSAHLTNDIQIIVHLQMLIHLHQSRARSPLPLQC